MLLCFLKKYVIKGYWKVPHFKHEQNVRVFSYFGFVFLYFVEMLLFKHPVIFSLLH